MLSRGLFFPRWVSHSSSQHTFPQMMEWPACTDEYEKLVIRMSTPRFVVSQFHSLFFVFEVISVILLLPLIMWLLLWFIVFLKSFYNLFVNCSSFLSLSQNPLFFLFIILSLLLWIFIVELHHVLKLVAILSVCIFLILFYIVIVSWDASCTDSNFQLLFLRASGLIIYFF